MDSEGGWHWAVVTSGAQSRGKEEAIFPLQALVLEAEPWATGACGVPHDTLIDGI